MSGNEVYVAGNDDDLVGAWGGNVAKNWKNGAEINLTDGKNDAYASSIFVLE